MFEITEILFLIALFAVAFLYASVGHGGASGYLALLAIYGVAPPVMKSSALIMNVFVSLVAFIQFYRGGYFRWKLFLPFAAASLPASFLGALITPDAAVYKQILGVLLLFPIIRLLGFFDRPSTQVKPQNNVLAAVIGLVIGFLSGMIGIGGGIILSPVLLLLHWANMKETAAISALFIFVNSVSALGGLWVTGLHPDPSVFLWIAIALCGGFAGAWLGSHRINSVVLKRVLAVVLLVASVKLITI